MAYPQVSSTPAKLSFAKIAAMPAPSVVPALPNVAKDPTRKNPLPSQSAVLAENPNPRIQSAIAAGAVNTRAAPKDEVEKVRSAIEELGLINENANPSHGLGSAESLGDDQSQLSSSSLKQQIFETKSMASVTTFAMDEKESIRPDDSASVRAVEEDDLHPDLSRNSSFQLESENHTSSNRPVTLRTVAPNVTIAARRHPGFTLVNPPRFGDLPVSPVIENQVPQLEHSNAISPAHNAGRTRLPVAAIAPDDKLLEALASPKDRLPLLQLEERIMIFIHEGQSDILELPPQNSFTRLLTHKLADYYNLAHQVTDSTSVRIFRNNCSPVPISLAELAKTIPTGPQQVSAASQVKIMRRAHLGGRPFSTGNSTTASSSVPSKTASENGGEYVGEEGVQSPPDGTPSRDKTKLTREEREAQYKAARDRIFSDFQETLTNESGSTGETSASMSRSSSSSGRRKSRKHKTPKDDSFDSRSAFIAYGPMQMQSMTPSYNDVNFPGAFNNQAGNYTHGVYGPGVLQPYPNFDPSMAYGMGNGYVGANGQAYGVSNGWHGMQQPHPGTTYVTPSLPSYQHNPQQMLHAQVNNQFLQSTSQSPSWAPGQYQTPYAQASGNQMSGQWQHYETGAGTRNVSYPYGQSAQQTYGSTMAYNNTNPAVSSYNNSRSLFNPQTRSFVPNHANRGGRTNRPKGSNNTRSNDSPGIGSPAAAVRSHDDSPKYKEDTLQQKYGTPSTLPKKPPPSQVAPLFSNDLATASSQAASTNQSGNIPLVVNGSAKSGL